MISSTFATILVGETGVFLFTSEEGDAKMRLGQLFLITQPVIRVKILTLVCSIPKSLKYAFISKSPITIRKSRANICECLPWAGHCAECLQRLSHLTSNSQPVVDSTMASFVGEDEELSQGHRERQWWNGVKSMLPDSRCSALSSHAIVVYIRAHLSIKLDTGGCPLAIFWGVLEALHISMSSPRWMYRQRWCFSAEWGIDLCLNGSSFHQLLKV